MRKSFVGILLLWTALLLGSPAQAQTPVEYVRYCSEAVYGKNFFIIPGTETCLNPTTGETKKLNEGVMTTGVTQQQQQILDNEAQLKRNKEGVAMSFALPKATIDPGKSFGAAFNVGAFDGAVAVGFGGAVGYGLGQGTVGGNAGLNISW